MSNKQILKENRDFVRLYRHGKSLASSVLVTYCMKNKVGYSRYGITATKKIGGAVERNRAKRLVRAAFRELSPDVPAGWDFIFVCRTRTVFCKTPAICSAMKKHIECLAKTNTLQSNEGLEQ